LKKILYFFVYWVWQFPQEIIGYKISRAWKNRLKEVKTHDIEQIKRLEEFLGKKIYIVTYVSKQKDKYLKWVSGFSIGRYICLTDIHDLVTIRHENGHCKQSEYLGWLYLLVIGVYSAVFCNLWDRWFHTEKKNKQGKVIRVAWCSYDRQYWYYKTRWTEYWADKLGLVDRDKVLVAIPRPENARYPAMEGQINK